ncbi:MAG: M42 family metallopeptidase [Firmicutes bacterium]|nr:M42 family metallopeptidase [Bacillota bacterium]MDD4262922.1 M42 family metallopeptidase [Bacillota bacterium]MDD4693454.1 M42 family metallopeptidase [Bacillota bacterium]
MKELLQRLTQAYGPSGSEDKVREIIKAELPGYETKTDALGNLIVEKKGSKNKIMFSAHMDEIGIIVTHIDKEGFLRFDFVGGVNPFHLPGERVEFKNGTLGVIGLEKLDKISDLTKANLYIDIGAENKEEAMKLVRVGDFASFTSPFIDLGNKVVSKAMDNRSACAVLIKLMQELPETQNHIVAVFTVQEEVGLRGARTAAFGVDPDYGIALDVTATGDTPKAMTMEVGLGKGAAIKVKDNSLLTHPYVKDKLIELAEQNNIPYQMEVLEFGGTDAGVIHLSRSGVPSGVISIPCRYLHGRSEMLDTRDLEAALALAKAFAKADLK